MKTSRPLIPDQTRNGRAWRKRCAQVYTEETHCAWCGYWVDQTLERGDPMSRTVDHEVELWQGGDLLPARAMTRLMHRRCNTIKSNKSRRRKPQRVNVHVDLTRV